MNTKIIKLDLNRILYDKIIAKQGDTKSRFLLFQLLDGSIPFCLTNRSVRAYMVKPDGKEIFNDLIINNYSLGYCTLELTNQVLAVPGTVKIELMVTEEDRKLTSSVFELEVIKSINSEKSIVSTNEFTALLNGLSSLSEYDNYKNEIAAARDGEVNLLTKVKKIDEQLDTKAIYVTPEMFGAKGDGITDDTQSFIQALETGKIFELKQEKVYRITQPINVPSNRILNLNNALILMDYDTTKPHNGRNNHGVFKIRGELKDIYPIDLDIAGLTLDKGYVNISVINDLKVGDYVIVRVDTGIYSTSKLTPSVSVMSKIIKKEGTKIYLDYNLPKDRWNFDHLNKSDFTTCFIQKVNVKQNITINGFNGKDILNDIILAQSDYQTKCFCGISIFCGDNIIINGAKLENGIFSTIHSEYAHNCEYNNIENLKTRKYGGGEGYVIQNISSNNVRGNNIIGNESRHTLDFTSGGYCYYKNIKSYDNKSNEIQFHGNYEHDIIIENWNGTNTNSESYYNRVSYNFGSGETFGNAVANVTFINSIFTSHNTRANRFSKNITFKDCNVFYLNPLLQLKCENCILTVPTTDWGDKASKRGYNIDNTLTLSNSIFTIYDWLQIKNLDELTFDNNSKIKHKDGININNKIIVLDNRIVNLNNSISYLGFRLDNNIGDNQTNTFNFNNSIIYADVNGAIEIKYLNKGVTDVFINNNKLVLRDTQKRAGIKFNGVNVTSKLNLVVNGNIDTCGLTDISIQGVTTNENVTYKVINNIGITDL